MLPPGDGAGQSRLRYRLQSQADPAGDGAERLDPARDDAPPHRTPAYRTHPARRLERAVCSDTLEVACGNGGFVVVAFALDCHDREALAHVAAARDLVAQDIQQLMQAAVTARFGTGRPPVPIQWLSDNGGIYTALDTLCAAERLHLVPITTPAYSPQSNGMSEAFVNTLRRDYLAGADLSSAAVVLEPGRRLVCGLQRPRAPFGARDAIAGPVPAAKRASSSPVNCLANWGAEQAAASCGSGRVHRPPRHNRSRRRHPAP
jgi:transposase InsO family protein